MKNMDFQTPPPVCPVNPIENKNKCLDFLGFSRPHPPGKPGVLYGCPLSLKLRYTLSKYWSVNPTATGGGSK